MRDDCLWVGQDPEGILGAPQGGHIARLEFRRRLERDSDAREAFERQVREEKERRRNEREVRASSSPTYRRSVFWAWGSGDGGTPAPDGRVPTVQLLLG